jgi:uncharacterized protein (TIGR02421 family)
MELPPFQQADRALTAAEQRLDYLMAVSPLDVEDAWLAFESGGFEATPSFRYRPLPEDLDDIRAAVQDVDVGAVEDPRVAALLGRVREELLGFCDLLQHRGTPEFTSVSARLHGNVDEVEAARARTVLDILSGWHEHDWSPNAVDARAFAQAGSAEIARLGLEGEAAVEIRDDVQGVMVLRGTLLVDSRQRMDPRRVEALVQHEVGTHIVTELNGREQPLRVLSTGLAGYEQTQEGLAVLAEHLVGGLTPERLALLAARVLTVRHIIEDVSFADSVDELVTEHGFAPRPAFDIVTRVRRGGGLLKDAVYLRGLGTVMAHLRGGGRLDALLVGKVALPDVPAVCQLLDDGVLRPPRVMPRWAEQAGAPAELPGDVVELAEQVMQAA